MTETLADGLLELLAILAAGVGAVVLTGLGVLAEQAGLQNLALGNLSVGAWETAIGAVVLFAGIYLLGYGQFWQRLRLLATQS
jgi:hypothetical protein